MNENHQLLNQEGQLKALNSLHIVVISASLVSRASHLCSSHVTWRHLTHYHVVSTALIRYFSHFSISLWNSQGQMYLIDTHLGG